MCVKADHMFKQFELKLLYFCLEMWSEAIKILKGEYTVRAIKEHKMDQAIIFCRTKMDCDNMEQYFIQQGGGKTCPHPPLILLSFLFIPKPKSYDRGHHYLDTTQIK